MQQTTRMSLFWTLRRCLIFPCLHFQLYLHFFLPAYLSLQWWATVARKVIKSVHQKRVKSVKKRAETGEKWQKLCTRNGWKVLKKSRNGWKVTKSVHQKRVKSVKKRAERQKVCTRNGWKVLIRNGCSRLCSVVCCREGKVTLPVRLSAHTQKTEQCSTEKCLAEEVFYKKAK